MAFSRESLPSSSTILSVAAYITATVVLIRTLGDLVPDEFQNYFSSRFRRLSGFLFPHLTVVIEEFDGLTLNNLYEAANLYLGTKISPSTQRIKVNKSEKDQEFAVTVDKSQEILDSFEGIELRWILHCVPLNQPGHSDMRLKPRSELRYLELSLHKKHKEMVLKTYLPYILKKAKEMREEMRVVRLHTVDYAGTDYWSSLALNHPATFDTLAMDPKKKQGLIEDLDRFLSRKDYYRRVGKAWKRGYLFYGPPGTGKSSLVAAMANYLRFDVYDLHLPQVQCDSDLRRLLIGSANRSILVIEDIDCNVGLKNREYDAAEDDKITLSGLLNFVDGLWSSRGDERIIVFTTNHKDRLDPAMLRPGRMDVHIEMSCCTFSGFKTLADNYLKIEEHSLFGVIEELLLKVQATPADIAGELMKSDSANTALQSLVAHLQMMENKS